MNEPTKPLIAAPQDYEGIRRALRQRMRLPLICAPMFLISGPDLVLAACRGGVIGSFPASNCRTLEGLEDWLERISSEHARLLAASSDGRVAPWAVNLACHRSNTLLPDYMERVIRYRAPIVITALGSPSRVVEEVHAYGGLVFADVNSERLARKAADCGVDGIILVASGAGGHTGSFAGFSFVPQIRRWWDGIVVLAGGICNGRGIRAAEVLGADLAYMGTRFLAVNESLADPAHKQMLVDCGPEDLVITSFFTGANGSLLRPSIVAAGLDPDKLDAGEKMDFRGQHKPRPWKNIWGAGQGLAVIERVASAAEVIDELALQYREACAIPAP